MKLKDIVRIRLYNQQLAAKNFDAPEALVKYMGAMQAQDYTMVKWAVGCRLPEMSDEKVEAALDNGKIIRTHLMRPTWHIAAAEDVYWMIALTAPQIRAAMKSRNASLQFTDALLKKSRNLIEKALDGGKHLTREELFESFKKSKIALDDNRSSHFLMDAEIEGIICSGAKRGNKQTYALLEARVPVKKKLTREEAMAELAKRYYTSHGPATLKDFVWWSSLQVKDAKAALETVKPMLVSEVIGTETYWFADTLVLPEKTRSTLHLLPAYDEFLISYKDRTASLADEHNKRIISANGIFYPVVLLDGEVAGQWRKTTSKGVVTLEVTSFRELSKSNHTFIQKAATQYAQFLNAEVRLVYS